MLGAEYKGGSTVLIRRREGMVRCQVVLDLETQMVMICIIKWSLDLGFPNSEFCEHTALD